MIWAKSFKKNESPITLSQHTKDILSAFENIKDKIPSCLHLPIKIAILYHDFGKVIPKFQIEKLGNKNYEPFDVIYEIPHSIFSIFWIDEKKLKEVLNNEELINFIISAVAYHHWRESFERVINGKDENLKEFLNKVLNNWKEKLEEKLKKEFENFDYNDLKDLIQNIKLNELKIKEVLNGCRIYNYAIPPYKFDYYPLRETLTESFENYKKWILISGFLQRCDHFASFCEEENEDINKNKIEISQLDFNLVKQKIKQKIGIDDENKIWQIQKVQKDKNIILIAPTGYGKTEFAFLWSADKKFFYTLPLRSAVNQIYKRAKEIFGDEKTGILHSDADVYLLEKEGDIGDTSKIYELSKTLSYPSIISTGDQFFPYALRPPGFEKIFSTFSYSNLIVDEVQAYDPKACAIIVSFIEWIFRMGGKFLLMSATMPSFVLNEIKKRIANNFELINIYEEEKEKFKRIFKHKLKIDIIDNENDKIEEILNLARNGKRILVILNTVKKAQEIYQKLKENSDSNLKNKIFLLHSRFTLEDRRKKEVELIEKEFKNPKPENENEGKILVATQVVEASLDIDADILFTEICPLDALVQRMGRVLRRYFYRDSKVINKSTGKEIDLSNEFKAYEIENNGNPNVYVWIFKNGLESGNGKVYSKELLKFSIAWLLKKENDRNLEEFPDEFANKEISKLNERLKETFGFLKTSHQKDTEKKSKRKKSQSEEVDYYFILENDNWLRECEIELSEYDKYLLVSNFYRTLPKDGAYLKEFYETIEILESGYMSDKKFDAQKIFREIYDVSIVSENYLEVFLKEVKKFMCRNNLVEVKFTLFKKEILSKFVVTIPYTKISISPGDLVYYKILEYVSEELSEGWKHKLKDWLSGIYVVRNFEYEPEVGLKEISKVGENFGEII